MKLSTNIVLTGNLGSTSPYVLQLYPNTDSRTDSFIFYRDEQVNCLYLSGDDQKWVKRGNEWYKEDIIGEGVSLPEATVRMYFPQYSVDTFYLNNKYILSLSTFIHGQEVQLGCFNILKKDVLACTPTRFDGMDEYFEYMDFTIADPFSLYFNDGDAARVRSDLGEPEGTNYTDSLLYATLYVVEKSGEDKHMIKKDGWTGGQNSIFISGQENLRLNIDYSPSTRTLDMNILFNKIYHGNLFEYLKETYNTTDTTLIWEWVVMDNNDIYYTGNEATTVNISSGDGAFSFDFSFDFDIVGSGSPSNKIDMSGLFDSYDKLKEGMFIQGTVSFVTTEEYETGDYIPFMTVFSNRLPLTQSLFSKMLPSEGFPNKINLNDIDMQDYIINTINKIEQNNTIVEMTKDSTKNHIIQPVFYQTRELGSTVLHPAVTENIALNLDSYKPQVSRFLLQIEGVQFKEIGRTSRGVIFKVQGNMLPKEANEGILYVLDQNGDLVTTGKYTYSV